MSNFIKTNRTDLIYPELSYRIVGLSFEVYNELSSGHREIIYHKAMQKQFELQNIPYRSELYHPLTFKGQTISKNYFVFLVDEKIVIELKRSDYISKLHFDQVNHYLKVSNLKLGLIISFSKTGVRYRRVLNIMSTN